LTPFGCSTTSEPLTPPTQGRDGEPVGGEGRDNPRARTSATPVPAATSEQAARSRLESLHGRAYTDEEWSVTRANLLAFFTRLARWSAQAGHDLPARWTLPDRHQRGETVR